MTIDVHSIDNKQQVNKIKINRFFRKNSEVTHYTRNHRTTFFFL